MLDALGSYSPTQEEFEVQRLQMLQLRAGMVLEGDVFSKDGNLLILKGGTTLTDTWIARLKNFAKFRGLQERIDVRIPRLLDARLENFGGSVAGIVTADRLTHQ
jgi:hypothetical protein